MFKAFWRPEAILFVSVFCLTLAVQYASWSYFDYTDQEVWESAVSIFSEGKEISLSDVSFGYPGMTILWLGRFFVAEGMLVPKATALSISILISFSVALATLLAYLLRKNSFWFAGVFGLLLFSRLYTFATPPSAVVTPLIVSLFLYMLYLFERPNIGKRSLIFLGVLLGLALLTRLDIGLLVFCAVLVPAYVLFREKTFYIFGFSCLVFVLGDTHLWHTPLTYIYEVFIKIQDHTLHTYGGHTYVNIFTSSPLAFISLVFGLILFFGYKKEFTLPRGYFVWFLVTTLGIAALLLIPESRVVWYFYPLLFTWEILLPLFLFMLLPKIQVPKPFLFLNEKRLEAVTVSLLIGSQFVLLLSIL